MNLALTIDPRRAQAAVHKDYYLPLKLSARRLMVSISRKRIKRQRRDREVSERLAAYALAAIGSIFFAYVAVLTMAAASGNNSQGEGEGKSAGASSFSQQKRLRPQHFDLRLKGDPNAENYNAIAEDIWQTLDCPKLLNQTQAHDFEEGLDGRQWRRRRLQATATDDLFVNNKRDPQEGIQEINPLPRQDQPINNLENFENNRDIAMDDLSFNSGDVAAWNYQSPTAAHLFCLVAMPPDDSLDASIAATRPYWRRNVQCPVHADESAMTPQEQADQRALQVSLLQLWSEIRADLSPEALLTTLQVAIEHAREFLGQSLSLWAPQEDEGLDYVVATLNQQHQQHMNENAQDSSNIGIMGLAHNLGVHKLFVDVGSCLGLTSMAVQLLYPGTRIVSIEAAGPSWLLQQLNWKCNAPKLGIGLSDVTGSETGKTLTPTVLLAGVGPEHGGVAKFLWRPQSTTSTRSWTLASERKETDMELLVKLRPWHDILAEAEIQHDAIDVLNVDCQGCEYNLIPAFQQDDFQAISTVLGNVHWGYIPLKKLPSSQRGKITHERLCQHENFARTAKECCAFPNLPVRSSVPGEVLVQESQQWPPKPSTVKDVAGALCDDFDTWAEERHLFSVESDWGWFQITSMAD